MKIITLYNQKGGVGKSTLTFNLAYHFSKLGNTLMWDFDSQHSLTYLSGTARSSPYSFLEIIEKSKRVKKSFFPTRCKNLSLIPATQDLKEILFQIAKERHKTEILSSIVQRVKDEFSFLFIDPQPSDSLLAENILQAADAIYIPLIPNPLNYKALNNSLDFIKRAGCKSKIKSLIFNMVDLRKKNHRETVEKALQDYPGYYREQFIPACSRMEEVAEHHQPLELFAGRTKAARQLRELAESMASELFTTSYVEKPSQNFPV